MEEIPAFIAASFLEAENASMAFYQATVGVFAAELARLFSLFLSIYLILWGLAHWRGLITEPIGDFATRVVKLALIAALSLNAAIYVGEFADRLFRIPNELVALIQPSLPAVPGMEGATSTGVLDTTLQLTMRAANRFFVFSQSLGLRELGQSFAAYLAGMTIEIIGLVLVGLGMALLLVAKIALGLLLAIGPLFFCLLLFDATRRLFQAWLGQVLTAMFTYVLASLVIYFALFVVVRYLNTALAQTTPGMVPALAQFIPFMLLSIVAIVLLLQIPAMAAAIGGGVQISTLGVAQAIGRGTVRGTYGGALALDPIGTSARLGVVAAAARINRQFGARGNRIDRN